MIEVVPASVLKQLSKLGSGEMVRLRSPEERRSYKSRPLTKKEMQLGYHKCPECGFPTKNRFRCHGCWEIFQISTEPEVGIRIEARALIALLDEPSQEHV